MLKKAVILAELVEGSPTIRSKSALWNKIVRGPSFISYRLAILHDTARVALEAGNSPEVIFGHYRELVTPEAARAWFDVRPA
ncbi:MAG: hypothetical protein LV480_06320 [Methylacidiphilales bacterium]|nr:hypothetical protein [Candidatus Methylacidiphilales bacterium]